MVAWLPRKGPLVLLVSFLPPLSFIHSLPSPSRVGGGTRSVSSMGSSDPPSSWSLPRFPGFMSKRQWAAEGASRGRRAARGRIFLRTKSREKKTEPTDSGGQWRWAIHLMMVDPASLKMVTLRPRAKKLLLCFCLFSRGSWFFFVMCQWKSPAWLTPGVRLWDVHEWKAEMSWWYGEDTAKHEYSRTGHITLVFVVCFVIGVFLLLPFHVLLLQSCPCISKWMAI